MNATETLPRPPGVAEPHTSAAAGDRRANVVMHVVGCPSVQHGSFEDYLLSLARACGQRGMTLVLVYPDVPASREWVAALSGAGAIIEVIPRVRRPGVACISSLLAAFHKHRPAVVHANFGRVGYLAVLAARACRAPLVFLTKHQMSDPMPSIRHVVAFRVLSRVAHRTFCVSEPMRAQLAGMGVSEHRTGVALLGVDLERFRPDAACRDRVRRSLGLSLKARVVLAVSHLRPGKGLEFLLPAMASVADHIADAVLFIAGTGAMRRDLEARARSSGLSERVRFLGMRRDIPELLCAADAFVCPSLSEGACSSVLEAMAAGKPVATTPVGYAAELIEDGRNGLVVPPEDPTALAWALVRMLEDPAWRVRMGEAARATMERTLCVVGQADAMADEYMMAMPRLRSAGGVG